MDRHVALDRFRAVMAAVALGDAMGMPVETMTPAEILAATGGEGIRFFHAPLQTTFDGSRFLGAGATTDDFQLAAALVSALIAAQGYDQMVVAAAHVEALQTSTSGWGGTTLTAVAELHQWFESGGKEGRSPSTPAKAVMAGYGAGNGVAMKVPGLALHALAVPAAERDRWLVEKIRLLAELTHDHPDAYWCAVALAATLVRLADRPEPAGAGNGPEIVRQVAEMIAEAGAGGPTDPAGTVHQLGRVEARLGDLDALRDDIGPDFSAVTSVPYAIGVALSVPDDFSRAVLHCVNDGGDSDSTAAMCGALVAANIGEVALPAEWMTFRAHFAEAAELGERLWAVTF